MSNQEQIEFALFYEEATQEVFIFRNIFGLIPIYYFQIPEQRFSISTDLPDLVRHENTLSQIFVNYNWVKNYLDFNGSKSYSNETIYSNVKLINPGHSLKINPSHFEEELATQFELERFKKLHTVEDFGHEFQRLFENSVKKNIGNQQIISAELSGGLDSSSVCAMARKLFPDYQMHTFFMEVPGIVIDESSFASIVAANLNATHHVLQPKSKTLDLVRLHTSLYGYPDRMISGPSLVGTRLETVQDLGLSTLLSGHDGDDIVGMGLEYPEDLFDNREWDLLQTELNHRAVNYSFEKFYPLWDTFPANKKQQLHLEDFIFSQLGRRHKTNSKK
ncbi:MAG: asparagine synthase-related protein, partial [Bacteroidia bacterium]